MIEAGPQTQSVSDFGAVWEQYHFRVLKYCERLTKNEADAEDLASDTFLKAFRNIALYDPGKSSLPKWFWTIASRTNIDKHRGKGAHFVQSLEEINHPAVDPIEALPDPIECARLRDAVSKLPPLQRQAIGLKYERGMTAEQIAELTRTPLGTVKTRLRTALINLRESFGVK